MFNASPDATGVKLYVPYLEITQDYINDDAAYVLTCTFVIFTMQTGFAMLECGYVTQKNVANIMVKNMVDVSCGGIGYFMFGYALGFGRNANTFISYSDFFFTPSKGRLGGKQAVEYVYQMAFSSTATTIVSGAVAERMRLKAYMLFSFINNIVYSVPAHWVWFQNGFLRNLGYSDLAGCGPVHCVGGAAALVAAKMLGPRKGRFAADEDQERFQMNSPVTALTGMFMLWWAWLAFNCGSTKSVTDAGWKVSAYVAINTMNGGMGGGIMGLAISMIIFRGKTSINHVILSTLAGLVSVTASASFLATYAAFVVGAIGASIAIMGEIVVMRLGIDDPVGAISVHLLGGMWGAVSVALFSSNSGLYSPESQVVGLFYGGHVYQLGVQLLGVLVMILWSMLTSALILFGIKQTIGIRMSDDEQDLGADFTEHGYMHNSYSKNDKVLIGSDLTDQDTKQASRLKKSLWLKSDAAVSNDTRNEVTMTSLSMDELEAMVVRILTDLNSKGIATVHNVENNNVFDGSYGRDLLEKRSSVFSITNRAKVRHGKQHQSDSTLSRVSEEGAIQGPGIAPSNVIDSVV